MTKRRQRAGGDRNPRKGRVGKASASAAASPASASGPATDTAPAGADGGDRGGAARSGRGRNDAREAELASRVLAAADNKPELHAALKQLSPREAAMFLEALERSLRKRKLLLWGWALAALAMIIGLPLSLYLYGTREPGSFGGWYFLVPFVVVSGILVGFGRLARRQ